jgi:hypothetical protein
LWYILQINQNFKKLFPLTEIEKNIISYKGPSTSKIFSNPIFPLKEDTRMLKVLAHMLGDGHVSGAFGTKLVKGKSHSEYRNFSTSLLDSFAKDLGIFGKIKLSIDYQHGHVIVPNLVGYLLTKFYKIQFDTFNSRIPKQIFSLNKNLIAAFIRAFADDEAHVYDSSIEFYSANLLLIKDLHQLILKAFPKFSLSSIKTNSSSKKNPKYSFLILKDSLEDYMKYIGFDCPKKINRINYSIKRRKIYQKYRINKNCSKLLLNHLKLKSNIPYALAERLMISHHYTLKLLRNLEKENKVQKKKKTTHGAWVWEIKDPPILILKSELNVFEQ